MTDVTNRTIAALLFVAMAVTVFSTAVTLNKLNVVQGGDLTGFAISPNATATLNVSATTSIKFVNAVIDWDNGTVNTSGGNLQCNLSSSGYDGEGTYPYPGCVGFATSVPGDFTLENDGNQNALITVELSPGGGTNGDDWIGGNAAIAGTFIQARDNEAGSCTSGLLGDVETLVTNTSGSSPTTICSVFQYEDDNDLINISLKVRIPSDAPTGVKIVDLIATASPV